MGKFSQIANALGLTPGRAEAIGQGAFGLGDEAGAFGQGELQALQSTVNALSGKGKWSDIPKDVSSTYNTALNENRAILDRQRQAEPYLTPALEMASGAAFSAPLAGAQALGAVNKLGTAAKLGIPQLTQGVVPAMKAAAPVGAVFGYGGSNAASSIGQAADTAKGALTAAGGAGILQGAGNAALRVPALRNIISRLSNATMGPQTAEQAFPPPEATGHAMSDAAAQLEHEHLLTALKANKPLSSADIVNPAGETLLSAREPEKYMDAAHVDQISDVLAKARQPLLKEPVPGFGANAPPADSGALTPLTPLQKWLFERLGAPGDGSASGLAAASPVKAGSSVGALAKTAPRRRLP